MSVFACEFDTRWVEHALENGKWPERGAEADRLFNRYHGRLSDPGPGFTANWYAYGADICGLDELREQQHEQNEG
ncbi:phage protein Gp37 [Escherichia coli]|uniref:phage protein Gp37 n=1 Tax=Escherichia coli TaxID=562 RepID=UPI002FCD2468